MTKFRPVRIMLPDRDGLPMGSTLAFSAPEGVEVGDKVEVMSVVPWASSPYPQRVIGRVVEEGDGGYAGELREVIRKVEG